MLYVELLSRFALISLLAFGGGQAALPLVERIAVRETGWLSVTAFGSAVAFGYLTPGPVLIVATFVGHQVAGLGGALAATVGAFAMPWAIASLAAQQVRQCFQHPLLSAFGRGAAPAVIGLLAVTALDVGRTVAASWPGAGLAAITFILALCTQVHPLILLAAGGLLGWLMAL
jgi:chromate transporter